MPDSIAVVFKAKTIGFEFRARRADGAPCFVGHSFAIKLQLPGDVIGVEMSDQEEGENERAHGDL
jgi:hypothetical protein